MNKDFLNECFDVIEQIKIGSIVEIIRDNEELKYRLDYFKEYEEFELTNLNKEYDIWDDGETLEEIKKNLMSSAIKNHFQKIRLIKI